MIEPLYCEGCGDEIGPEHRSDCEFENPYDDRDKVRYCHLCGCSSDVSPCFPCLQMLKERSQKLRPKPRKVR